MVDHSPELEALPPPIGDEILFSRIARFAFLIGEEASTRLLPRLLGHRMHSIASGLPTGLSKLEGYFNSHTSASELMVEATHAPYYWPFLSAAQRQTLSSSMMEPRSRAAKLTMGLVASRVGAENSLRFCTDCRQLEEAEFGIAVWHRAHQLPGVLVCPAHGGPLVDATQIAKLSRHRLLLPRDVREQRSTQEMQGRHQRGLLAVATLSSSMLPPSLLSIDRLQLRRAYFARAAELGLVTTMGSLRQALLVKRIETCWSELADLRQFRWLHSKDWFCSMLRTREVSAHPIKHLMLCGALDLTPSELLLRAMTSERQQASSRREHLFSSTPPKQTAIQRSLELISEGSSCRSAAVVAGIDTQTAVLAAMRAGLSVAKRPKLMKAPLTLRIQVALASGQDLKAIASAHSVSNSTVWRVLNSDEKLEATWTAVRLQSLRGNHRRKWLQLLSEDLRSSIKQIRATDAGNYAWLYRHDREWLSSTVSARGQIAKPRATRTDAWVAKDFRLAAGVKALAAASLAIEPPDGRISRSRLLRALSCEASFARHPGRYPLLRAALAQSVESVDDYQLRRVLYWDAQLSGADGCAPNWLVLKRAGIGRVVSAEIQAVLSHVSLDRSKRQSAQGR
jgi:hypothetical protein